MVKIELNFSIPCILLPVEDDTIVKQSMLQCKQSTVNVDVIGVQPQFGGIDWAFCHFYGL